LWLCIVKLPCNKCPVAVTSVIDASNDTDVSRYDADETVVTVQIPSVIYKLKSLMQLFLRFNRIRAIENDIRKLKVRYMLN